MTRTEENKKVINYMDDLADNKREGTFEEMVVFSLGGIATLLADISKSLAIIADKNGARMDEHKCTNCKHYTAGEFDGSCGSYICEHYSDFEMR